LPSERIERHQFIRGRDQQHVFSQHQIAARHAQRRQVDRLPNLATAVLEQKT